MAVAAASKSARRVQDGPLAIEVREVEKTFRIPVHRIDSFKERVVHPLAQPEYRILEALREVSFDVHSGEFFGIVGRNGSGKSTLLKILASIYRADGGSIRMAGRVAPFIELGVGFNPDLTARENVTLNGVMMGLSRREARARLDAVLDFAELREFVDLKLKNYSSGMLVRLAFSVMIQAEADILLIDEVLAVGDAAFQQKCRDVFAEMKDDGRTIVLVTHDMTAVQRYCHRAMLLDEGELRFLGDPEETGRQYLRMNFERRKVTLDGDREVAVVPDFLARVEEAWLEDENGEQIINVEIEQPIRLHAVIEARQDLVNPGFGLQVNNADGVHVFELDRKLAGEGDGAFLAAGSRAEISATIENPLTPGRYAIVCWVAVLRNDEETAQQAMKLLNFVVFGIAKGQAIVSVPGELGIEVQPAPAPEKEP
ncbi:MAG TPA: ABC transporter ATP-binding protein [Solirubrobacterales bacterium]|jgi:ABC-type polysaccharide/polyol phosphate transport system ATPase subunit